MNTCFHVAEHIQGNPKKHVVCPSQPAWEVTMRGIVQITFRLCAVHFAEFENSMEKDTREWVATPINHKGEPCTLPQPS